MSKAARERFSPSPSKTLLTFLGYVTYIVLAMLWSGFVVSVIWGWFVVTAFHAAPLSVPLAIGITILVRTITFQEQTLPGKGNGDPVEQILFLFVLLLLILGMAALVHLFV